MPVKCEKYKIALVTALVDKRKLTKDLGDMRRSRNAALELLFAWQTQHYQGPTPLWDKTVDYMHTVEAEWRKAGDTDATEADRPAH